MFMKIKSLEFGLLAISMASLLALGGCGKGQGDVAAQEAPPPATVMQGVDVTLFSVDHPEQYPPVTATRYRSPVATGRQRASCFRTSRGVCP